MPRSEFIVVTRFEILAESAGGAASKQMPWNSNFLQYRNQQLSAKSFLLTLFHGTPVAQIHTGFLGLIAGQWRSSVHFFSNPAKTHRQLLFSIACLLSLTLFTVCQARADGFTITVVDNGDMPVTAPSLIITGSSSAASVIFDNCGTNGCTIALAPNPFFTAVSIPSNFYLDLPGNPDVADWYQFILSANGDVTIGFANTPPIDPLCSDHSCTPITGAPVIVGQITWDFLGDPVTDTIQFETASGGTGTGTGNAPAPEPSSLLLLLGGLVAGIAVRFRGWRSLKNLWGGLPLRV
jgi:hypothetical protein